MVAAFEFPNSNAEHASQHGELNGLGLRFRLRDSGSSFRSVVCRLRAWGLWDFQDSLFLCLRLGLRKAGQYFYENTFLLFREFPNFNPKPLNLKPEALKRKSFCMFCFPDSQAKGKTTGRDPPVRRSNGDRYG